MARIARVVVPDLPHHVTQRGNFRQDVFFVDEDRRRYLSWLAEYADRYGVRIWAWCLMNNHVHFVAVPERNEMDRALPQLHQLRPPGRVREVRGTSGTRTGPLTASPTKGPPAHGDSFPKRGGPPLTRPGTRAGTASRSRRTHLWREGIPYPLSPSPALFRHAHRTNLYIQC
jgi:hypothetical protein